MSRARLSSIIIAVSLCLNALPPVSAAHLTPAESRGKSIYREGASPSGKPVTALLGPADTALAGSLMPCVNCHGEDGRGRPEATVLPPDITWANLIKPYGHKHPFGRTHGPFTEQTVAIAITQGMDPAGNHLDPAMPKYRMAPEDLTDLIAYLKAIETDHDPGLTDTEIRVGIIVPAAGRNAASRANPRRLMERYFTRSRGSSEFFQRRIQPVVIESAGDAASTLAAARELIARHRVFAILSIAGGDAEADLAAVARRHTVPVIQASVGYGDTESQSNRFAFYLLSGIETQVAALVEYGLKHWEKTGIKAAIVHGPGQAGRALAERIAKSVSATFETTAEPIQFEGGGEESEQLVTALKRAGIEAVVYLAPGNTQATFLDLAAQNRWTPWVLVPGSLASRALLAPPRPFAGKILLAYPTLPQDRSPLTLARLTSLTDHTQHLRPREVVAFAMINVMEEGLRRAGRRLSRDKFTAALEQLSGFGTGLTPPISFSQSRHVGSKGAYVFTLDPFGEAPARDTRWIEPQP